MKEQEKKPTTTEQTKPETLADKDLSFVAGGKELLSTDQADSAGVAEAITTSIDDITSK